MGPATLPISAACHDGQCLHLRLEGGEGSVAAARPLGRRVAGRLLLGDLNEQRLSFFDEDQPLWRLSLPNNTPKLSLPGRQLIDWGGAQRWLKSDAERRSFARSLRSAAMPPATATATDSPFQPLPAALMRYTRASSSNSTPGHLQPRPPVRGALSHANHIERQRPPTAPRRRSRKYPAHLRALRLLQCHLPDLSTAWR
jgi:glycolate oxidase FAD binding subunit